MKICLRCKNRLSIDNFSLIKSRNKHKAVCKQCDRDRRKENRKRRSKTPCLNLEFKLCNSCNKDLGINNFYYIPSDRTYTGSCKKCRRDKRLARQKSNKAKIDEIKNKLSNTKKSCITCKEFLDVSDDNFYFNVSSGIYINVCKKCCAKRKRKYKNNRKKTDTSYRLRLHISATITTSLRNHNSNKKNGKSCFKFINYNVKQLKVHLESQFENWMTWSNWGVYNPKTWDDNDQSTWTWQIDHIIPQSKFSFTSMEDDSFKECWALENLRPYSAKQNISDGNRSNQKQ